MAYKQHFIEWFSGKQLPSYWTTTNYSGTGTFGMNDSIDGGFQVTTGGSSNNNSGITFNNKRQYDHTNSVLICNIKRVGTTSAFSICGFAGDITGSNNYAHYQERSDLSFKELNTKNTVATQTSSSVSVNNNLTNVKIECGSADVKMWIDGVLEVTKTTNRPAASLQPIVRDYNLGTGGSYGTISTYLECYNT